MTDDGVPSSCACVRACARLQAGCVWGKLQEANTDVGCMCVHVPSNPIDIYDLWFLRSVMLFASSSVEFSLFVKCGEGGSSLAWYALRDGGGSPLLSWASHISAHTNYGCTSWNLRRGALLIIAVALSADAQARWCLRDGGG
eukprot:scaffold3130_cov108-Isochrysis_galbana.AAC.4